ncbi:phage major capsid protein [Kitasatospora sp. MAP5-34]|uniref:phage major capsid protein n=1 Tax=Kitasatospora sp. MAP5-34 TaxID=3035102 RepID=UPI002474FD74|nr:phage major capsid protein [Kitasatospora sp. MAP5-34]MDH6580031.1 HK97 family phage major capsid protein [Kitasatospora sp. MAP5-34]
MSYVQNLVKDSRRRTWEKAKILADRAANENRNFTGEENAEFIRLSAELDQLDARLVDLARQENRSAESAAAFGALESGRVVSGSPASRPGYYDPSLGEQLRDAVLRKNPAPIDFSLAGSRSGYSPGIEKRATLTTSGNVGITWGDSLVQELVEQSSVLSAGAFLLMTESGEEYRIPRSSGFSTATLVAEGATIPESDPGLGAAALPVYKFGFLISVTTELAQDASFDLVGYLTSQAAIALANGFGKYAITGTGSGQPSGVANGISVGVTGATGSGGKPSADNLFDLQTSLASPYLRSPGAAWLMETSTLGYIRTLKDSMNRYLFDIEVLEGTGSVGSLLGEPVYLDPGVDAIGLGKQSLLFGDWSRFYVRIAGPNIRFERSDEFAFDRDLIFFRCLARMGSVLVDNTGAIKSFKGGAS